MVAEITMPVKSKGMNRLKMKISVLAFLMLANFAVFSQISKNSLKLPEIPGYQLLKCDFHIHTVFSDGMVWPTTRVNEAFQEGLDAIALTEHIEYRPKLSEFTSKDHLRSYEVAQKTADEFGIILIKGTEITRRMAPGHFNAIFLKDANIFETFVNKDDTRDGSNIAETLAEGKKQGAFVFWNHPWFQHPENRSEWQAIHEELYQKGLISGIEVVNGGRYDPIILQWCLDKNLTILSNSDIHTPMTLAPNEYRSMTLVFAKERSEEAIQEALANRMTVAYSDGNLYGKEELVRKIVEESVVVKARETGKGKALLTLENISGIPYLFQLNEKSAISMQLRSPLKQFRLDALSENAIQISSPEIQKGKEYAVKLKVMNVQVGAETPLDIELKFKL